MQDKENEQKCEGKTTLKIPMCEEMENVGVSPNGHAFWVLTCPKCQKHFSPKMGFPQIRISLPILFPSPCNNYFNQFLAKLNDWVNETRKVVDSLMGSPIDIWIFPIGPQRLNIPTRPPLSLANHAPISLFVALT